MREQIINLTVCLEEKAPEAVFGSLIDVLQKELEVCAELKAAVIIEKKALIHANLDEIHQINAVKENILLKARMIEEARMNIFRKIARMFGLNESGAKLSQLVAYAPGKKSKEIMEIAGNLAEISEEIKALNENNRNLLDVSLTCVEDSLHQIISMMTAQSAYLDTGKVKTGDSNGRFLNAEG